MPAPLKDHLQNRMYSESSFMFFLSILQEDILRKCLTGNIHTSQAWLKDAGVVGKREGFFLWVFIRFFLISLCNFYIVRDNYQNAGFHPASLSVVLKAA
jgi:hypothetical protein